MACFRDRNRRIHAVPTTPEPRFAQLGCSPFDPPLRSPVDGVHLALELLPETGSALAIALLDRLGFPKVCYLHADSVPADFTPVLRRIDEGASGSGESFTRCHYAVVFVQAPSGLVVDHWMASKLLSLSRDLHRRNVELLDAIFLDHAGWASFCELDRYEPFHRSHG